jgi:predicted Rossmann fold nucleotide-binding protein DprA/Smf involved in DNA uptake
MTDLAQGVGLAEERLRELLGRGMQLALAVERWNQAGIWVVCRGDPDYPGRYRVQLGEQGPPVLYGAGVKALFAGGGLAAVGSRDADEECLAFAAEIGTRCARGGIPLVSGGARGVDAASMSSALAAGGTAVGVVADTLLERSLSRAARAGLAERRLLLVSPYHPEARFNTGNAMARNKLIYALADYALVICSGLHKGGTWTGAVEELRRKLGRPVFVRLEGATSEGNEKLADEGALPFPRLEGEPLTLEWLSHAATAGRRAPTAVELSLLPSMQAVQAAANKAREPQPVFVTDSPPMSPAVPAAATIYDAALRAILSALDEPRTTEQLVTCPTIMESQITKTQLHKWLKRAVDEGAIRKLTRPVRYARNDAQRSPR